MSIMFQAIAPGFFAKCFRGPGGIAGLQDFFGDWKRHNAAAHPHKHLRLVEQRFKFADLLLREGTEVILGQPGNQKRSGDNIIDFIVFIPEGPVQLQAVDLAFLIDNQAHRIFIGINDLDIAANCLLQVLQPCANLHHPRVLPRFHQKNSDCVRGMGLLKGRI